MNTLEEYTTREVIENLVLHIVDKYGFSKSKSKQLVLNALTYNIVIAEVENQVDFLVNG